MAEIGSDIEKAITLLKAGELVAIPTETVYGLAGNALDVAVVAKIFEAKGRPRFDPLIVHVADMKSLGNYVVEIPDVARRLIKKFWPGPLTLLLKKKSVIPDLVTAGLDTVAVRSPNHPFTKRLLESLPFPLAAPSANPFGYVSPTRAEHVNEQLGIKIKYILDGGPASIGIESTIVGFDSSIPIIHRLGGISQEEIESEIGSVVVNTISTSDPKAPGQLQSHYAPGKKLILGDLDDLTKRFNKEHTGILSFQKDYAAPFQFVLSSSGNMAEAAQNLFLALRTLDRVPVDVILAESVPDVGLGRAINDRLRRAAGAKS
jgi:L-threonylcarbamoyladenylate synthase